MTPAEPKQAEPNQAKSNQGESKQAESLKPIVLEAEDKETLPIFDLQDVPNAMDKLGFPVAAKAARKWFASPKHIYNGQLNSVQPIDDRTVTLKWALRFGTIKDEFNELMGENIYSDNAVAAAKKTIIKQIKNIFINDNSVNFSFDVTPFINDLRQFHIDWKIQFRSISTRNTLDGLSPTDLTCTLGDFNIYVAIGRVGVTAEKFYKYDNKAGTKTYCIDTMATITHVYAYLKDYYSFIDRNMEASQYLGHWNKDGMIVSYPAAVSGLVNEIEIRTNMGSSPITKTKINWDYLPGKPIDKPVDKRTGLIRKFIEKDVYWPVYNRSFNEWREKHNRGGDFAIYSKPQLYKLRKPITIKLETICRPPEVM